MIGADLLKVEHEIVGAAIGILKADEIPVDLWAVIADAAAGQIKDCSLSDISGKTLEWRQRALDSESRSIERREEADARDDA